MSVRHQSFASFPPQIFLAVPMNRLPLAATASPQNPIRPGVLVLCRRFTRPRRGGGQERFRMPLNAYHRLDVWSLMNVYRATFAIMCEANLQLPFAVAEAWGVRVRA